AAALLFGFTAKAFVWITALFKQVFARLFRHPIVRPFIGGLIIIALVYALGTREYLGLGLPLLEQSFDEASAWQHFLLKLIFTSVTLGAGFYGGEVTPLFVIGA